MQTRELEIFGAVDGLVACMAIVLATAIAGGSDHLVWHAALGLFVAEGFGMAVSEFLGENKTGWKQAALMGISTGLPILTIGIAAARSLLVSVIVAILWAAFIASYRGGGWKGWVSTYGLLIGVSSLAALSGWL